MSKFSDEKSKICKVCENTFGQFKNNFVTINDKGVDEVKQILNFALEDAGISVPNLSKYLYIVETCGSTMIKK